MHSAFTPVELEWGGRFYEVKAHKVMGLISRIEQHLTLGELQLYAERETVPLSRLCSAYAAALAYAGARVSAEDVYEAVFSDEENREKIMQAIGQMTLIMLPASARRKLEEIDTDTGDSNTGNQQAPRKTRGALSNKRTKSRLRKSG